MENKDKIKEGSPEVIDVTEEDRRFYKDYADSQGFALNPNEKIVEGIIKGLKRNEGKHGAKYCPCRRVTGDKEKDKNIICPCIYHKEEIANDGRCHCMLFVK